MSEAVGVATTPPVTGRDAELRMRAWRPVLANACPSAGHMCPFGATGIGSELSLMGRRQRNKRLGLGTQVAAAQDDSKIPVWSVLSESDPRWVVACRLGWPGAGGPSSPGLSYCSPSPGSPGPESCYLLSLPTHSAYGEEHPWRGRFMLSMKWLITCAS